MGRLIGASMELHGHEDRLRSFELVAEACDLVEVATLPLRA